MIYTLLMDGLEFGHVETDEESIMCRQIKKYAEMNGTKIEMKEKHPFSMRGWRNE